MRSAVRRLLLCSCRDGHDLVQGRDGNKGGGDKKRVEELGIDFGELINCTDELDLTVEEKKESRTFFKSFA